MSRRLEYYREAVTEALSEAGVSATDQQIAVMADLICGAAEMEREAHGDYCIPHPLEAEVKARDARHRKELAESRREVHQFKEAIGQRLRVHPSDRQFIGIDYDNRLGVNGGRFRPI